MTNPLTGLPGLPDFYVRYGNAPEPKPGVTSTISAYITVEEWEPDDYRALHIADLWHSVGDALIAFVQSSPYPVLVGPAVVTTEDTVVRVQLPIQVLECTSTDE